MTSENVLGNLLGNVLKNQFMTCFTFIESFSVNITQSFQEEASEGELL